MKKLLFLILLAFLFSCEKNKDECYECTTTITTIGSPYASSPIVSTVTSCGISENDAREIERKMTATATSGSIVVRSVTNCRKQ
jgi:hypothetical protein